MRLAVSFFICIIPVFLFAQNTKTVLLIRAESGPVFTEFKNKKAERIGWLAGVHAAFPIKKNLSAAFGLTVRNLGEQISFKEYNRFSAPPGVKFYRETFYNYRYFGLPVTVKYTKGFVRFFAGLQPLFFMQQFEKYDAGYQFLIAEDAPEIRPVKDVRMINVSSHLGLAFCFQLGEHFELALQGQSDLFLQSVFRSYPDEKFRFSVMPALSVAYVFKQKAERHKYFPHEPGENYFKN